MNIILKSDADSWFGRIVMRRIYCNFPLFEVQTVCLHRRRPGVPLSPPDLLRRTVGNLVLQADTDGISLLFIPQGGGACECGCVCAASQFLIMTWLLCVCTPEEGWGVHFDTRLRLSTADPHSLITKSTSCTCKRQNYSRKEE